MAAAQSAQAIAHVVSIKGEVHARAADGSMRLLKAGDQIHVGETLVTGKDAQVVVAFKDGHQMTVLANESFQMSPEVAHDFQPDPNQAAISTAEINTVIDAIEQGGNLDQALEETAAGLGGGGENGGNSFVRLLRISEGVTGVDYQYGAEGSGTQETTGTGDINQAPVASPDAQTLGEDTASVSGNVITGANSELLASADSDPDSDPISVTAVAFGDNAGALSAPLAGVWGTLVLNADGSYTYTPNAHAQSLGVGDTGIDQFTYTVTDPAGAPATTTLTLTVVGSNDGPVAGTVPGTPDAPPLDDPNLDPATGHYLHVIPEDTSVSGLVRATDPDNDPLTFSQNSEPSHGTVTVNPDGSYTYTPDQDYNGNDSFTVLVDDGNGGTDIAVVDIIITPVDDPSVLAPDSQTIPEDTTATGNVLANDFDVDNDLDVTSFTIQGNTYSAGQTANLVGIGTLTIGGDGSYTFVPVADWNGQVPQAVYTVNTGSTSTLDITVTPVADASDITPGAGTVIEDTVLSTSGHLSITDADGPQEESFVPLSNVAGAHGTFGIDANGNWGYSLNNSDPMVQALNAGQTMTEVFTVHGVDGTPSTVVVTIVGVNDNRGPNAQNDSATTDEDVPVSINVLGNDSDPDGDPLNIIGFGQGSNGSVALVGGQLVYTPNTGFTGTDTFTYTIDDGHGATDTATVTVNIAHLPVTPVANDDTSFGNATNNAVTIDVLGNDSDSDGTLDPASVQIVGTANPGDPWVVAGEGIWTVDTVTGAITFAPLVGFTGDPTPIQYTVADNDGLVSNPATVTVDYGTVNPISADDSSLGNAIGTAVTVDVLSNDNDPDGSLDPATVQIIGTPTAGASLDVPGEGTWSVNTTTGEITFTPESGFIGDPTPIQYMVLDNDGNPSGPATVTVDYAAAVVSVVGDTVMEGNPNTFTVTLSSADATPTTVNLTLLNGSATVGMDTGAPLQANYGSGWVTLAGMTATVPAGATSFQVRVPTTVDAEYEQSESYTLQAETAANSAPVSGTGTITDDNLPVVSISGPANVNEGAGTITYTVTLSNPSAGAVTVDFTTANGTALAGSDYAASSGTLTFAAGETSKTITVDITNDDTYEGGENYAVNLTGSSGAAIGTGSVTTTIHDDGTGGPPGTDDDRPVLNISGPVDVNEGAGTITYTVTLSNPAAGPVTVNYGTANGSALAGSDYTASSGTLTFAAGETTKTITVDITNDATYEGAENYSVNLSAPTGGASIGTGSVTTTIHDDGTGGPPGTDDDRPVVTSVVGDTVAEGTANTFTVTLSNDSTTPTAVSLALASGSATVGSDTGAPLEVNYGSGWVTLVGMTATVPAGATSFQVRVPTTIDAEYETSENYTLQAATAENASPVSGTGTITDDNVPVASISGPANVNEAAGTVTYTVTLSNPSAGPVTVNYGTANGSALAGSDYATSSGVLTFAAGETSKTITVDILNDGTYEGAENYTVNLTGTSGATIGTGTVTTTIHDDGTGGPPGTDDDRPVLNISGPVDVNEGAGTITYTVTLSNPAAGPVTVNYGTANGSALAGSDYTASSGTLTFAAGETTKTITVDITNDATYEGAENYTVNLTAPTGGASIGTGSVTTTIHDDGTGGPPGTDDDRPVLNISGPVDVNEGAGTITYTVTLSNPAAGPVTVNYGTANGSALAGSDYTASSGVLTFAAGETTKTITVDITNDATYEGAENYSVNLSAPTGGASIGTGSVTTTIHDDGTGGPPGTDDDRPVVTSVVGDTVAEGTANTFTVTLSNDSTTPTAVSLALASGSATVGSDTGTPLEVNYGSGWVTLVGMTATVPAGATSFQVRVPTTVDTEYETSENYTLQAATAENASPVSGTGTITDDNVPVASISGPANVNEAAGTVTYTVTLSNPSAGPVTVNYGTANGSALAGSDYATSSGVLTFAAGETSKTITVDILNDGTYEGAENYTVNLTGTSGATIGTGTVTTTIHDDGTGGPPGTDDDRPVLNISGPVDVNEGAGTITYTVTLSNPAAGPVTVNYGTANGSALAGSDYTASSGTLTFAAGETTKTITVDITNDATYEGAENYSVNLSGATGGASIGTGSVTTTIHDDGTGGPPGTDDDRPVLNISGPVDVNEGAGTITYTVTLSNPAAGPVTVNYGTANGSALAGSDYTASSGVLTFAAGETSKTITVDITNDATYEGAENYSVNLSAPTGGASIGTGSVTTTIHDDGTGGPPGTDDDRPVLNISGPVDVNEGAGTITYTVTLSNPAAGPVTVNYGTANGSALAGSDYTASSGTLTFAAGETTKTITVDITNDATYEGAENYSVNLSGATGGASIGTGSVTTTIHDDGTGGPPGTDDDRPVLNISGPVDVNEGAGTITYTVTLSNPAAGAVTVNYGTANGSALAGSDYTASSGTLTFAAGETTKTITVDITNDATYEGAENYSVNLSAPTGGASIGTGSVTTTIHDDGTGGPPGTDDDRPVLNISGPVDVNEGAGTITYTVTLSNPSANAVTVNYGTANGSALAGSDYTTSSGVLTFAAGETTKTITVDITNDATYEGAENYSVNLSGATGGASIGTGSVTTTIHDDGTGGPPGTDDDRPVLNISGPVDVNEGAGTITYTVTLSNPAAGPVTVNYGTANGSALAGSDYTASSGTLTFAAGETTKTITVGITNDTTYEGAENYSVNLSAPTGGASIGTGSVTTTIHDDGTGGPPGTDDDRPVLNISGPVDVNEGAGTITYTVTLSNPASGPVTVNYGTANGSALAGSDYTASSGTLTFAAGETTKTITVDITNDATYEGAENYSVNLTAPTGGASIGTGSVTTTIHDDGTGGPPGTDDDRPVLNISGPVDVNEGAGTITYTVTLSNPAAGPVTVNYGTANGSALAGSDYTASSGVLTFAAGETTKTITVDITNDATYEGAENYSVNLSGATGGASIGTGTVTTTIHDDGTGGPPGTDDDRPVLNISGPVDVNEGAGTITYTVTLSNPAAGPVTVNYGTANGSALAGSDYTASSGTLTFAAGETTKTITVDITNDATYEGAENYSVNLSGATGGASIGTGSVTTTIHDDGTGGPPGTDDDRPVLNISGPVDVNEGAGTITYTVTLSNPASGPVTVNYGTANGSALAGSDYTASSGTLTFAAGETTKTITVDITNDTTYEGAENYSVNLSAPTGGASIGTGSVTTTIHDDGTGGPPGTDDDRPVLNISGPVDVNEGAGTITYTVTLSNPAAGPVTVNYGTANGSALAGSDYTASSGTLTFAAGETTKTITVDITNDATYEGAENYSVNLSAPTGGASIGTGSVTTTIHDDGTGGPPGTDDDRPVVISVVGDSVVEGTPNTFTVTLSNPSTSTTSVDLALSNGTATVGVDTTTPLEVNYGSGWVTLVGTVAAVPANVTSFQVRVPTFNDTVYEGDESYTLAASTAQNAGPAPSGTGTITDFPDINPTLSLNVSEEGLPGGVADTAGTVDTTDSATAGGSLWDGSLPHSGTMSATLSLSTPPALQTATGEAVTWTGTGTNTLVGSAVIGGVTTEVVRISVDDATGNCDVVLSQPIYHAVGGTPGVEDVRSFGVDVSLTDGTSTRTGVVTVGIEDDSPHTGSSTQNINVHQDNNILIVLDMSTSMRGTNLTAAKAAIDALLKNYDAMGNVQVQLVTFGSNATVQFSTWQDAVSANATVQALQVSGTQYTNYDAAINSAMNAFVTSGKIAGANNVAYFLTDGVPTAWYGNNSGTLTNPNYLYGTYQRDTGANPATTDAGLEDNELGSNGMTWTQFLNANEINAYAIGFSGAASAQAELAPIAYNGVGAGSDPSANVLVSPSTADLTNVLLSTLPAAVSGNLLVGATPGAVGADGGHVGWITVNGKTFTWNLATDAIVVTGSGASSYTWNATDNILTITTAANGKFEVDMDTGVYSYRPPLSNVTETIGFSLTDNDGDSASGTLTLNVTLDAGTGALSVNSVKSLAVVDSGAVAVTSESTESSVLGTEGDDTLAGTGASDILIGGAGNDTLTGLAGSDTFRWHLGDGGTTAAPAEDTVTDFDLKSVADGGDILDLRDLLVGESHSGLSAGNLTEYLHFSYDSATSSTVVEVKSQGASMTGPDQIITLSGVDLTTLGTSDQAIIQNLLASQKLITD